MNFPRTFSRFALTIFAIVNTSSLSWASLHSAAPPPELREWQRLVRPTFARNQPRILQAAAGTVGFRVLTVTDESRIGFSGRRARTFPLYMWYPASTRAATLPFGYWIDQLGTAIGSLNANQTQGVASISPRSAVGDSVFIARASELGGNRDSISMAMPRVRRLPTSSIANATPAPGRFPLIVFPEYTSPASSSILAEFLAARGFVVISFPLSGTFSAAPDNTARGLENVALDVAASVQRAKQFPFVDANRVGSVGVGISASALLMSHLMSPVIASIVSLEGGITTPFEIDMIRRSPWFDPSRVRAPLLAITAPHPSVDAARLDMYPYAPQLRVHFPRMGEFWFLNYGWLDQHVRGIIGTPPGNPLSGFESALFQIEGFFAATLKRSAELTSELAGTSNEFTVTFRAARPLPPTAVELISLYRQQGESALLQLLSSRRAQDPNVLPTSGFVDLVNGVGAFDTRWTTRRAIASLWMEGHPQSARAPRIAALGALAIHDTASARAHVANALRLVADDPDPFLEPSSQRRTLQQQLNTLADQLGVRR